MSDPVPSVIHATAVAVDGKAVLMVGPSGSGKSSLAIQLVALGAVLIADDQCEVFSQDNAPWVRRPDGLPPLLEARGLGLLDVPVLPEAQLSLIVDMARSEESRLPEPQTSDIAGYAIKMINKGVGAHFTSAVLLYLKYGKAT